MTPAELQQGIADLIEENRRLRAVISAMEAEAPLKRIEPEPVKWTCRHGTHCTSSISCAMCVNEMQAQSNPYAAMPYGYPGLGL